MTRIYAAAIGTETNTFSPIPTGLSNFLGPYHFTAGNAPETPHHYTAPLHAARRRAKQEKFTLIEGSGFGTEPSGTCARKAYEHMRDTLLAEMKAAMPLDGVLLGMHGAFVAEGYDDVEGDILEKARKIVGDKCVIGVELDPHCHLTKKRVSLADIIILYKEYPHVDFMPRAEELLTIVLKTIRGEIRPVASLYDCRMIAFFPTTMEPTRSFVDRMSALEGATACSPSRSATASRTPTCRRWARACSSTPTTTGRPATRWRRGWARRSSPCAARPRRSSTACRAR